jgi:hypothetical protein
MLPRRASMLKNQLSNGALIHRAGCERNEVRPSDVPVEKVRPNARQSAPCTSNHVERIERRGRRDALNLWPRSLASHPPDALRAPGASRAVSAAPSRSF